MRGEPRVNRRHDRQRRCLAGDGAGERDKCNHAREQDEREGDESRTFDSTKTIPYQTIQEDEMSPIVTPATFGYRKLRDLPTGVGTNAAARFLGFLSGQFGYETFS